MSTDGPRSRVFRQVVSMEVVWTVDPGEELPHTDWEADVRDAVLGHSIGPGTAVLPCYGSVSEVEELEPRP
jgi:hypothetical protein